MVATGSDADITFAQLMIPHHEQAVQMADMALQQATSPEVTDLATQIKAAQDPEIQQMRGWLQQWGAPEQMDGVDGMDHGDMDMGGQTAGGMMSDEDMGALMDASGADFDRMWLTMMIAHHEGAIEMAEQVKAQSTNPRRDGLGRRHRRRADDGDRHDAAAAGQLATTKGSAWMTTTTTFAVIGMTCGHCVSSITRALTDLRGLRLGGRDTGPRRGLTGDAHQPGACGTA